MRTILFRHFSAKISDVLKSSFGCDELILLVVALANTILVGRILLDGDKAVEITLDNSLALLDNLTLRLVELAKIATLSAIYRLGGLLADILCAE